MRPDESLATIGYCGMSCSACRYGIDRLCRCVSARSLGKTRPDLCPVAECVSKRKIAHCLRDCPDGPCLLYRQTVPYHWCQPATPYSQPLDISASSALKIEPDASQSDDILRVFCLGHFRVFLGNREVQEDQWGQGKGPTQKVKALFAYLLCNKGKSVSRDTLTDIFWPGQVDPKRASSSFHQALFYLRRALEPDIDNRTGSRYICYHNGRYFFNIEQPHWTDADAFQSYIEQAQFFDRENDTAAAIGYWQRAIDLYGGDFMVDIDPKYKYLEFNDWSGARCRHLRQLFLWARLEMAHYYFNEGNCGLAIENAKAILNIEPAFEPAHRMVMRCLTAMGEVDNALYQYQVCKEELSSQEDRLPSHQTQMLWHQIAEKL